MPTLRLVTSIIRLVECLQGGSVPTDLGTPPELHLPRMKSVWTGHKESIQQHVFNGKQKKLCIEDCNPVGKADNAERDVSGEKPLCC